MSTDIAPEAQTSVSGPGAILRRAREAKGLHISVLATSLRVPVERIRALEGEQWGDLPDLVFARALAMSVCRHLKIDAAPVLAGMPDPDPLRSVRVTAAISQPLGGMATASSPQRSVWLLGGLVLMAVLTWFMIGIERDARPSATVEVPEMPPPAASLPAAETSGQAPATAADAPATPAMGAEADKPVPPAPVSKP